jgi:hypothetical protein
MPRKSRNSHKTTVGGGGHDGPPPAVIPRKRATGPVHEPSRVPPHRMQQHMGVQHGGMNAQSSSGSAWQYVQNAVGDGNTQWKDTFEGPTNMYGNSIRNVGLTQPSSIAETNILKGPFQSGGRKSRKSRKTRKSRKGKSISRKCKSRSRRGGFFGSGVLGTAAVPFGLLAAQQYYSRRLGKNSLKKRTRNYRGN